MRSLFLSPPPRGGRVGWGWAARIAIAIGHPHPDLPPSRGKEYAALATVISLLLATPALANDTFATLGAGGLVPQHTAQVAMESEDLQISPQRIAIHYRFRNTTGKDVDATVAFPLPDLNGGDVANEPMSLPDKEDRNFVDFSVTADGRPVAVRMETRAFRQKGQAGTAGFTETDVTEKLRAAGLSIPYVALDPLNAALLAMKPEKRAQLEKEELLIPETGFNPPLKSTGKTTGWWATWTARTQFYWTQHFPAGKTIELVQTYKPVVGGGYVPFSEGTDGKAKDYCGGAEAERAMQGVIAHHLPDSSGIEFYERTIDYILTTANNWSGPIGRFHLTVTTGSPEDILMTCLPGLTRIAPGRYELERMHYRPDRDLKLLILQSRRPPEIDGK